MAVFITLSSIVAALIVVAEGAKIRQCPGCQQDLPRIRKPTSVPQMLWGGWTCPHCGCETNRTAQV